MSFNTPWKKIMNESVLTPSLSLYNVWFSNSSNDQKRKIIRWCLPKWLFMSINPFFWEFYAFLWYWLQVRGIVISFIFWVVFSINNYYINQNFNIELILGFDTSFHLEDLTIEPAKRPNCLIGRPGPPQTCCFE
jgi:hypothetical protein